MAPIDTKNSPYFDDYSDDKNFHRILYRPSFAVQARELTQVQTILQKQVERFANHIFEDGAMVIPGFAKHDTNYTFVKVNVNSYVADETAIKANFLDRIIVGATSGIKARVVNYIPVDSLNIVYLYVKYISGSPSNVDQKVFLDGEVLAVQSLSPPYGVTSTTVSAIALSSTGVGLGATITQGVYYVKGFFVVVGNQQLVAHKDNNTASLRIGLQVTQSLVKPEDDESLLDNAAGAPNYAAPGAHRLKIELTLVAKELSTIGDATANEDFIELLRIKNGLLQKRVNTTAYSIINQTLARRTFDESGNYTVRPFMIHLREFFNENDNEGVYTESDFYTATSTEATALGKSRFNMTSVPGYHTDISYPPATPYLPGNNITEFKDAARSKVVYGVEAGKAYVRGYEIETITQIQVDGDKARDIKFVPKVPLRVNFGSFVRTTNLNGTPPLGIQYAGASSFVKLDLRDRATVTRGTAAGSVIGSARAFFMEFESGTPATIQSGYKIFLFDIKMNNGRHFEEVQQLYWNGAAGPINLFSSASDAFTADVNVVELPFLGTTVTTSGQTGTRVVLDGNNAYWNTLDTQRLSKNDCILLSNATTTWRAYVVEPPTNNNILVVDIVPALVSDITVPAKVSKLIGVLEDTTNTKLLIPLQNGFIKGLTNETTYKCQKQFLSGPVTLGNVVIQTNSSGDNTEIFDDFSNTTFFICKKSDGEPVLIDATQVTYQFFGRQITIAGLSALNGEELVVVAPVVRTQHPSSVFKTKTHTIGTFSSAAISAPGISNLRQFFLGKADVTNISHIWMSPDFTTAPTGAGPDIDILERYTLDDGQRDMFYDISSINLDDGAAPPTGRIAVVFDWFEHAHDGTYFSVDSYANIDYKDIPTYKSVESSYDFLLSDVLDFRPTINAARTNFDNTTGSMSFVPFGLATLDYEFYLNRRDKMYLTPSGEFIIDKGTSAVTPSYPSDPFEGMVLYDIDVRAFTKGPQDIFLKFRDNKRYTMRDIGKLDQRVANIEYYTQLSLLEKQTGDLEIKDFQGNDRFKNGFIVDPFDGHGIGNTSSADYRCSIDKKSGILRPIFAEESISCIEGAGTNGFDVVDNTHRNTNFYTKLGDMFTLPVTGELEVVSQRAATKNLNVNPHAVFNFLGTIKLDPALDQFKDTQRVPDQIVQQDLGIFDAFNELTKGMGTIWGEWSNLGSPVSTAKREESHYDEIFPGPAFHVGEDGNPDAKWGNESLTFLQTGHSSAGNLDKRELRKTNRKLKQLKAQKAKTASKRQKKNIQNKIKKQNEIKKVLKQRLREDIPLPNSFPKRTVTSGVTTTVTRQNQTRQGVRAVAKPGEVNTDLGDKVVDVSFAEYMRSVDIFFVAKLFKPNTKLFAFFERDNVNALVRPANISGTPTGAYGDPLITDSTGTIYGIYTVPAGKYRTGSRVFKLTDSPRNDDTATTQGSTIFQAMGIVQTQQKTIISTRTASISLDRSPQDNQTIVTDVSASPDIAASPWVDPLAQSFVVDDEGGVFLSEIQVFFASKDPSIPVTLEVREMVNGYPGPKVLPFSTVVVDPVDVHTNAILDSHVPTPDDPTDTVGELIVDNGVPISNFTSADFVPTIFRFDSPIYIQPGVEYCFVVMANTTAYTVWISSIGQRNVGTRIPITGQPYAGVLFSSQNASTWSADQSADMMFVIKKYQFDTAVTGNVTFVNETLPLSSLEANPFKTRKGDNRVKVTHARHGFRNRDLLDPENTQPRVKFTGVTGDAWLTGALNNDLNDNDDYHIVYVLDLDHYYIKMDIDAEETLYGTGGPTVSATKDVQMDALVPTLGELNFPQTQTIYSYKPTSGNGVHGGIETPYLVDPTYRNFVLSEVIEFDEPKLVASEPNEINSGPGSVIGPGGSGSKSLFINAQLKSSNPNLTPVIDSQRTSVIAVANIIDDPGLADVYNTAVEGVDYTIPAMRDATGTVSALVGATTVTVSNGLEFHIDGFISFNDFQLRKITAIAGNLITLDRPLLTALVAATVQTSSSNSSVYTIGQSYSPNFVVTAPVLFDNSLKKMEINDPASINIAAQFDPGDMINISGGVNTGITLRVARVLVTSTEATIYFDSLVSVTDVLVAPPTVTLRLVEDVITCSDLATTEKLMQVLKVGKYIRVIGSALSGESTNDGTYEIKGFERSGAIVNIYVDFDVDPETFSSPAGLTLMVIDDFFSQSSGVGSAGASKYLTRRMTLTNPASAVRVNIAGCVPEKADFSVWVKLLRADATGVNFDDIPYFEIDIDNEVPPAPSDGTIYSEHSFTLGSLPQFTAVAVKIVMESSSSTEIPRFKDFSLIALDS